MNGEMKKEKWEELYLMAAVEVDGKRMPERIEAVREAIRARLADLERGGNHHEERVKLKTTLGTLDAFEAETRKW